MGEKKHRVCVGVKEWRGGPCPWRAEAGAEADDGIAGAGEKAEDASRGPGAGYGGCVATSGNTPSFHSVLLCCDPLDGGGDLGGC